MPKWAMLIVVPLVIIGAGYVVVAALFGFGIIGTDCQRAAALIIPSPSQSLFAEVETEICGAGPMQTIVSLSTDRVSRMGTKSWSFFRAPSARKSNAGEYLPLDVRLNWLNDHELEVGYPKGAEANAAKGTYNGVKVTFREFEPRGP